MIPVMEIVMPQQSSGNVPAFLAKLWKIVDNPETGLVWKIVVNPETGLVWKIVDNPETGWVLNHIKNKEIK